MIRRVPYCAEATSISYSSNSLLLWYTCYGGEEMTITMSEKHQVTIPKRIADAFRLKRGSLFEVEVKGNRIELIPLDVREKTFTAEDYRKLDKLVAREKGLAKKVTKEFISSLKKGKK